MPNNHCPKKTLLTQLLTGAALLSVAALSHAQTCEPRFRLLDLGTLNNADVSWASAINRNGAVVGGSYTGDTWSSPQSAFVYNFGSLRELSRPADSDSNAYGINNLGQVAGVIGTVDGNTQAVIWDRGSVRYLGNLGYPHAEARDINDRGQVAGQAVLPEWAGQHAVVFTRSGITDLGTLGGDFSYAEAINSRGDVVGASTVTPEGWEHHAFLYSQGQMRDLGTIGCPGNYSIATDINDFGNVVGLGDNECGTRELTRGFLYRNGQMTDLGDLGFGDTLPRAINNVNQVIGVSSIEDGNIGFFFWQDGVIYDLSTLLVDAAAWVLTSVDDINDRGEIVGQAYVSNDNGDLIAHAMKLTPTFPVCN